MRFAQLAAPIALAGAVAAAPLQKRAYDDGTILNYALTLEHLEATFYAEGLKMYNAGAFSDAKFPSWVRERFTEIASQEATHVTALTGALQAAGVTPVKQCTYNFGITSPEVYLATAQILEGVGVSAYLGAAPSITNKAYLAVAGSILVVEAEHDTWVRSAADTKDPFPRAFAPALDFNQVYSLAAPFITSCPAGNPTLPFKPFPSFTVNTKGPYYQGGKVSITIPKGTKTPVYAAFVDSISVKYQEVDMATSTICIPEGIAGESFLILTKSNSSISDANTIAGPAILEVAVPAMNFSY